MTRDDIIHMGREVGIDPMVGTVRNGKYEPKVNALKHSVPVEWLESFAELVAATEREKIAAMILDTKEWRGRGGFSTLCNDTKHVIAAAIRARKDSA